MNYHNITHDDMLNGDGIRVVLWLAGCEHHCAECQNPVTWNPYDGKEFGDEEFGEIINELSKDYVSGITFSGGDPMHPNNRFGVFQLIQKLKDRFPNKTVWLYTGYTWEELLHERILPYVQKVDVLVDGKFEKDLADKKYHWVGSTNQRIIDVQKSIKEGRVILYECN